MACPGAGPKRPPRPAQIRRQTVSGPGSHEASGSGQSGCSRDPAGRLAVCPRNPPLYKELQVAVSQPKSSSSDLAPGSQLSHRARTLRVMFKVSHGLKCPTLIEIFFF